MRGIQKVDSAFDRGINGSRLSAKDLLRSYAGTGRGVIGKDALIHATIHPSASSLSSRSSAVYETDRKKCKLWQGYSRIPRLEGEEIALSAVHIFCADGCGQGETETSLSGIFG